MAVQLGRWAGPRQHPRPQPARAATPRPIRRWARFPRAQAEQRGDGAAGGDRRDATEAAAQQQQPSSPAEPGAGAGQEAGGGPGQQQPQGAAAAEQQKAQQEPVSSQEDLLVLALVQQQAALSDTVADIQRDLRSMWPPWGGAQSQQQGSGSGAAAATAAAAAGAAEAADPLSEMLARARAAAAEASPAAAAAAAAAGAGAGAGAGAALGYSPGDKLAAVMQQSARRLAAKLEGGAAPAMRQQEQWQEQGQLQVQAPWAVPLVVVATWLVFVLEWAPLLPGIWAQARAGHAAQLLAPLLTSPGSGATMALVADGLAVMEGSWQQLLTAGLLHGGLLPLLVAADGIADAGTPLELSLGGAAVLVMLALSSAGAVALQVLVAEQRYVLAGAGAMAGMYAALTGAALRDQRVLLVSPRGLLYAALSALWAWYHPNVGLWSLAGGVAGGLVGLQLAPWIVAGLRIAVGLPLMFGLATARLLWKLALILAAFVFQMVHGTLQAVAEAVRTVRNL